MVILVVEDGVDAFITTHLPMPPSFSSSSRRHRKKNRFMCPPNKESASVGRLDFCYKRLQADPPKDLKIIEPDAVAESIEKILREQRDDAGEQAFIGSLDAWTVASNKARKGGDEKDNRIVKYGKRMEDVLTLMEKKCVNGTTVDAYATVIHLYIAGKESYAALRVLGRMENQLLVQQRQRDTNNGGDVAQNLKLRLIQYNRVLQGLGSTSQGNPSHLKAAFKLLMSMCLQEEFVYPPANLKEPFLPTDVKPDAKSFAMVMVPMLLLQEEDIVYDKLIKLIDQARNLDQLNDFLLKKIERAMTGSYTSNERFDIIKKRLGLP